MSHVVVRCNRLRFLNRAVERDVLSDVNFLVVIRRNGLFSVQRHCLCLGLTESVVLVRDRRCRDKVETALTIQGNLSTTEHSFIYRVGSMRYIVYYCHITYCL